MAGRRLGTMDIHEIILHIRDNQSNRAVGRDTGFDRRTVRRYRKWVTEQGLLSGPLPAVPELERLLAQTLPVHKPPQTVSSVEPYRQLVEKMHSEDVEGAAIWHRLREQGYMGGQSSIYRFLKHLDPPLPGANAVVRVERPPAEEAQVDFGYVGLMLDPRTAQLRKTWAFVMTLSFSRHQYVEFVFDQSLGTWITLHRHALEFFGGVPRRIVIDNLKSAVTRVYFDGTDPELQASYRECAEHYGFLISPCQPRTPEHKGKVESGVHYVKRNFMGGRVQTDINQANDDVRAWCLTTAGERNHGTIHEKPLVVFAQIEQPNLKPLPPTPYDLAIWKEVKLHRDCHIVFDNSFYSAPFRLIGQKLRVRAGADSVRLYNQGFELVATHTRAFCAGQRLTNEDHLPWHKLEVLNQTRESVLAASLAVGPVCWTVVGEILSDRALDRLPSAARLVRLGRKYGNHRLERACQRAQEFGSADYKTVKGILLKDLDSGEMPLTSGAAKEEGEGDLSRRIFARSAQELLGRVFGSALSVATVLASGAIAAFVGKG
jgi:transposase